MKKLIILALAVGFLAQGCKPKKQNDAGAAPGQVADLAAASDRYKLANGTATWQGGKIAGTHNGGITIKSAELGVKDGNVVAGNIVLDVNSITNEDVTDAKDNAKLVGHLKSDDFFASATYPDAKFEIVSVAPLTGDANNTHTITGNLTIKKTTRLKSVPANIKVEGDTITAKTSFKIDRSKFDVRYGSKTFFADIGDKVIYDDFDITVDATLKK